MLWEEKIDRLKRRFSPKQFRVPFSDWSEIFKEVEGRFISKGRPIYKFRNWSEDLKDKTLIRDISRQDLDKEISRLEISKNYWVFIVWANNPASEQFVYHCNVNAMSALLSVAPADFYIGHKKYAWLVYFKRSPDENTISLIKSGDIRTPFD